MDCVGGAGGRDEYKCGYVGYKWVSRPFEFTSQVQLTWVGRASSMVTYQSGIFATKASLLQSIWNHIWMNIYGIWFGWVWAHMFIECRLYMIFAEDHQQEGRSVVLVFGANFQMFLYCGRSNKNLHNLKI